MGNVASFEEEALPTVKALFAQTAHLPLCAFGFACALLTWFPVRIGVDLNLASGTTDIAAIVFLLAVILLQAARPSFRLSGSPLLIGVVGVVSCACFALFLTPVSAAVGISGSVFLALETLYKLLSTVLLLLWLEQSCRFPVRNMLLIMGTGCCMLAVLELFFLGMNAAFSLAFFALSPTLSTGALLLFLKREIADDQAKSTGAPAAAGASAPRGKTVCAVVVLSLGVFVFSIVGSLIQAYMMHAESLAISSVVFSLSDVAGLLLASAVLVCLAAFSHGKTPLVYVLLVMPTLLAMAYVMSTVMPASWANPSFSQLIVVRRLAFVFWLVAAVACPGKFLITATTMLAAYRAAQAVGFSLLGAGVIDFKSDFCTLLIVGELTALIIICVLISLTCLRQAKMPASAGADAEASPQDNGTDDVLSRSKELQRQLLGSIAAKYHPSNRETEALELLAEGWRAAAIAEKLVIAQSTAKNHMNRIYGKLGVHTQDELMRLIEAERENR